MRVNGFFSSFGLLVFSMLSSSCNWEASRVHQPVGTADAAGPVSMYHRVRLENSTTEYGCSFLEFDHSGDALEPKQLEDCLGRIRSASKGKTPIVFIYCHGWHHNSQSEDVMKFRDMLSHFAASLGPANYSIHGVYMAWPASSLSTPGWGNMKKSAPIAPDAGDSLEGAFLFNYWDKKGLAASRIGPSPRFQDSIARVCKETHKAAGGRVVATGHSFGAYVLERAVASDMLREPDAAPGKGPLPDLLFFFNSAAHATDAFQSVSAMSAAHTNGSRPRVVSVTTPRDFATSAAHFTGNLLAGFSHLNQRWYYGMYPQSSKLFQTELTSGKPGWTLDPELQRKAGEGWFWRGKIHASEFVRHAPGHADALMSHGFTLAPAQVDVTVEQKLDADAFTKATIFNLTSSPSKHSTPGLPKNVMTCIVPTKSGNQTWNLHPLFPKNDSRFAGRCINQTPYWVIPLPDAFLSDPRKGIRNHGDIWKQGHFLLMSAFMKNAGIFAPERLLPNRTKIEKAVKKDTIQRQSTEAGGPQAETSPAETNPPADAGTEIILAANRDVGDAGNSSE